MERTPMAIDIQLKRIIDKFNQDRLARGESYMSPRAIALKCDLSPSVVSELLRKKTTRVDLKTLDSLSNFLSVTPNDILGYTKDKAPTEEALQ